MCSLNNGPISKFSFPLIVADERLFDRVDNITARFAVAAQIGEVVFVQHNRACAYQFFAFEVAINIGRQVFVTEHCRQPLLNGIERRDRAAVVILPMRFDQLFGNPLEPGRIERQCLG